ncbi:hypothetical protein LXL04_022443 [Taraxacum kok-saghyz]
MGRTLLGSLNDTTVMYALKDAYSWWDELNNSPIGQDLIFHVLSALYGVVTIVALVQLIRIQLRVPEYGWTTQKVFHFLNVLVNGVRCLIFLFHRDVQQLKPEIVQHVLLDVPSLAFFTTYALLVLFWAEIYYQARAVSTDGLRPTFFTINGIIYTIQMVLWLVIWWKPITLFVVLSKMFFAGVSLFAALGFLLYGGRSITFVQALFNVAALPCRIKRQAKEATRGWLCDNNLLCVFPCKMYHGEMCFNAFDDAANLDLLDHPVLNFIYYLLVEILPSSLVLMILRKLPPKQAIMPYHPIR